MLLYSFIVAFILGLIIGSFLNCLIWRLHEDESLLGRSYCPHCRHMIAWYDNIPLLSFFLLGGKCRHCHKPISWQYPSVELATAVLFLLLWQNDMAAADLTLRLLRDWFLAATFVIIFVYDLRWQLVPMVVVWSASAAVLILNLLLGWSPVSLLLFGAVGTAFFLAQYLLTARRGVGEGDIWLGLLLGLAFPSGPQLLLVMIVSYVIGAVIGLGLVSVRKKGWQSRIALGPFLMIGAFTALIWGDAIINWYLGLL